jgi:DNA polymerase-3 subunit beta
MEIRINRKSLSDALSEIGALAGKCKALTIYNNTKVVTKGNRIRLQTSDIENTVRKYLTAEVIDGEAEFLIDGKSVSDYLKALRDDIVIINVADNQLTINHSKGKASFPTHDAEDFAEPKLDNECTTAIIPSSMLTEAIENGLKFVATDTYRPVMCNIHAYIKDGKFTYAATDTRKMIFNEIPFADPQSDFDWTISAATAPFIKAAAKTDNQVTVSIYENMVSYHAGDTMIFAQKVQGNFPDCKRIIPTNNNIVVEVDKNELLQAVKRASMLVPLTSPLIKISVSLIDLLVSADDVTTGKKASEAVTASSNATIDIGFSAVFLLDCLNAQSSEKLKLTFSDPGRPMLIVDDTQPFKSILLMPMTIN